MRAVIHTDILGEPILFSLGLNVSCSTPDVLKEEYDMIVDYLETLKSDGEGFSAMVSNAPIWEPSCVYVLAVTAIFRSDNITLSVRDKNLEKTDNVWQEIREPIKGEG